MSRNRYLLKQTDSFAGFAHAILTYLSGVSLADLHGLTLIHQPLQVAHGLGFAWDDFFAADPRGLVPPLAAPLLSYDNTSLLIEGVRVLLVQVLTSADPPKINRTLSGARAHALVWLRKGRSTMLDAGCCFQPGMRAAGLWLRERFWQAAHSLSRRRSLGLPGRRGHERSGKGPRSLTHHGAVTATAPVGVPVTAAAASVVADATAAGVAGTAAGPTPTAAANVSISIHVRRGDVTWLDRYGAPSHRWVETESVLDVLRGLSHVIGLPLAPPAVEVHLHSERGWLRNDTAALRVVAPWAVVHLDS